MTQDGTQRWPLPEDHSAARLARTRVGEAVKGWPKADDAILIASELVANAVDHGAGPIFLLLEATVDRVRIGVENAPTDRLPAPREAGTNDSRGRGLAMVAALADEWGWEAHDDRLLVWAELTP